MKVREHCGPAFPFNYHNETSAHQTSFVHKGLVAPGAAEQYMGLSIRDYFAAKALSSLLNDYAVVNAVLNYSDSTVTFEDKVAKASFRMADAMLKAGGHHE